MVAMESVTHGQMTSFTFLHYKIAGILWSLCVNLWVMREVFNISLTNKKGDTHHESCFLQRQGRSMQVSLVAYMPSSFVGGLDDIAPEIPSHIALFYHLIQHT